MVRKWTAALLLALGVLSGCQSEPASRPPVGGSAATPPPGSGNQPPLPTEPQAEKILTQLVPIESGPGVMVLEPAGAKLPGPGRTFGRGYARWLHLYLAGQTAFGKSPAWSSAHPPAGAMSEAAIVRRLHERLGLTHVIALRLEPLPTDPGSRMALSARILKLPDGVTDGEPVELHGTEAELMGGLAKLGQTLAERIGGKLPEPADVSETADDLRFLGSLPWNPGVDIGQLSSVRLDGLASKSPLATIMLAMRMGDSTGADRLDQGPNSADMYSMGNRLLEKAGENNLLWFEGIRLRARSGILQGDGGSFENIEDRVRANPGNYLLQAALTHMKSRGREHDAAQRAAEQAVLCAPGSLDAWHTWDSVLSSAEQDVRRGRTAGSIRGEEWGELSKRYDLSLRVAREMVKRFPKEGSAWASLSRNALFAGDGKLAVDAIEKAIRLSPLDPSHYAWGMELSEPKWLGDAKRRASYLRRALAVRYPDARARIYLADYLMDQGLTKEAMGVLRSPAERLAVRRMAGLERSKEPTVAGTPSPKLIESKGVRVCAHSGSVQALAWSDQARAAATGGGDRLVKVTTIAGDRYDTRELHGHEERITGLAWSPDGSRLASCSEDRTIRVWDRRKAVELRVLKGHDKEVTDVAWDPSGDLIASASRDSTVRIWDAATGKELRVLYAGAVGGVVRVAFSPDGGTLLMGSLWDSNRKTLLLWNPRTGKQTGQLGPMRSTLVDAAWSADGKRIATVEGTRLVRLWDVTSGKEIRTLATPGSPVRKLAWSPDGRFLVGGARDQHLRVWDTQSGVLTAEMKTHVGETRGVVWLPGGKRWGVAGSGGSFALYDIPPLRQVAEAPPAPGAGGGREVTLRGDRFEPRTLVATGDLSQVINLEPSGALAFYDAASGTRSTELPAPVEKGTSRVGLTRPVAATLSPDGKVAVTVSFQEVSAFRAGDGGILWTAPLSARNGNSFWAGFSGNGALLAVAGPRGATVYDSRSGALVREVSVEGDLFSLAWSSDGKRLALGHGLLHRAGFVTVTDVQTGKAAAPIEVHSNLPFRLSFSVDGRRLASCSDDGLAAIIDVSAGKLLTKIRVAATRLHSLVLSSDGGRLAVVSADHRLSLWDVNRKTPLGDLDRKADVRVHLMRSADGRRFMSGRTSDGPSMALVTWGFR